jgi:hypothetical protein
MRARYSVVTGRHYVRRGRHPTIGRAMNVDAFRSRLGILGLSVRRFAAMTGVSFGTARHWGGTRKGYQQAFPRWVPLMLEMMNPAVSRNPPDEVVGRPHRSDGAWRQRAGAERTGGHSESIVETCPALCHHVDRFQDLFHRDSNILLRHRELRTKKT